MMNTPDKNRISAVSLSNVEDSPVFQYINDLSPIEPVNRARAGNLFHSLASSSSSSPSSLFSSPQIYPYRDSRFSIKRHRSLDLSSPLTLLDETVKISPDTNQFKEQISVAIEFADTLKTRKDGCDIEMVSCENDIGRVGSKYQSDELCRQLNELDADSEAEIVSSDGIQNSEQEDPKTMDCRYNSFTSPPPRDLSICCNNSGSVVELGSSYNVQIPAKAPGIALSSLSNVAAIDSTTEAEEKEEIGIQPSCKERSVRRRCLTFEVGGTYNRIPLRDSTNDLPFGFTSNNKAPNPEECLVSTKQETDEILPIPPRTIGLHLNGLMNPSASCDRNKSMLKDGELSTPVSTKRVSVSYDNKITEEATERSMEGTSFEELGKCKRCRCRKSKCLKLYCDCFAAGLYCVEPCACENCFNKPIHEEIVMKTRRDIEARNPLAFAPKVVSTTSDYATRFGDENSKTPASARHMRGCNCKKSGCLKKYCECFLMGVGCSPSCRCVGCKNFVGHTNEQFQFPCAVGTSVVAINEQAKDHGDYF